MGTKLVNLSEFRQMNINYHWISLILDWRVSPERTFLPSMIVSSWSFLIVGDIARTS